MNTFSHTQICKLIESLDLNVSKSVKLLNDLDQAVNVCDINTLVREIELSNSVKFTLKNDLTQTYILHFNSVNDGNNCFEEEIHLIIKDGKIIYKKTNSSYCPQGYIIKTSELEEVHNFVSNRLSVGGYKDISVLLLCKLDTAPYTHY